MPRRVIVVGAGLAGLAAAVQAQRRGARVVLQEAASHAGGRCRSYFDDKLGVTVDNGNHLLFSGNHAAIAYLRAIGAADTLIGPPEPDFPFFDAASGAAWTIRMSAGRFPRWIFDADARVPDTQPADYFPILPLFFGKPGRTVDGRGKGRVWDLLARPMLRAMLNTEPVDASATMVANVVRETLAMGGQACRPLIARHGLSNAFVGPALRHLQYGGAEIRLGSRIVGMVISGTDSHERVSSLAFEHAAGSHDVQLAPDDAVILAVPPDTARELVPGLAAPDAYRAIATVHFAIDLPDDTTAMMCIVNGTSDWLFTAKGRVSVTMMDAGRLLATPREALAHTVWQEAAKALRVPAVPVPPWQVVMEQRATFAAVPSQEGLRAATKTRWNNLTLAGDWTATGLPATIEGAIRSGQKAADALMNPSMEGR
ncbi:hydroxysqualene dehydroxylase HpnE [Caballeronia sp. BR00000012568055]|uniref:hydroxysqualene dehydroxylase HpnE n=1 Tax=Caballeronia sp. BR00000012568055 TaxID=2918761 RepID=UPI0023F76FDB|nr:hydroxysqualene dehydroxylase HpnE [Caballeronia sp. BR00000012568055]